MSQVQEGTVTASAICTCFSVPSGCVPPGDGKDWGQSPYPFSVRLAGRSVLVFGTVDDCGNYLSALQDSMEPKSLSLEATVDRLDLPIHGTRLIAAFCCKIGCQETHTESDMANRTVWRRQQIPREPCYGWKPLLSQDCSVT